MHPSPFPQDCLRFSSENPAPWETNWASWSPCTPCCLTHTVLQPHCFLLATRTRRLCFFQPLQHCSLCLDHPLPSLAAAVFKSSLECPFTTSWPSYKKEGPAPGFCYSIPTPSPLARHSTYSSVISLFPGLFSVFPHQTISSTSLGILPLVFFTKYPVSNHTPSTYQANHMNLANTWWLNE